MRDKRVKKTKQQPTTQPALVCAKILHPSTSSRLSQHEIRILQRVRHPNVIHFFHAVSSPSQNAIVMEFCAGGDLRAFLRPQRRVDEARVWSWLVQLCLALQHLHDRVSLLHRDLKTANIFLNDAGFLVLGDFGVASTGNLATTAIGTPLYMAPEMWDNRPYDCACDLWALGCVLYEICMGRPPFEATSTPALVRKVCDGTFPPLPAGRWSTRLRELVGQLLSVDPTRRPRAAAILKQTESAIHLERYLLDRRAAAARLGSSGVEVEDGEQQILQTQLQRMGITITLEAPTPSQAKTEAIGGSVEKTEHQLTLEREQARQEQLRNALQRLHEMRQQQHEQNVEAKLKPTHDAVTGVAPLNVEQRPQAIEESLVWKPPAQSRPKSSRRASGGSAVVCPASSVAFSGIPRTGVPLTQQSKAFVASQKPVCRDVRDLRKKEAAKAARRYRLQLDEQFNASSSVKKALGRQNDKQNEPAAVDRDGFNTLDGNEPNEDDGVVESYLAELEALLRQRLGE
ncbi:hypothetical protein Poli38472_004548 [Pythium oligandrum]|uniref:non-specific serine/threonine protein kinase n=1 Tax=Pythium oligandrum TaxID=41045 RepID=A0A8K1CAI2_PYTOL|nr:hypothetical protein Poli38472_004548 [Pythium oligandrum]|eukprot:TMW59479.1 hypothetical protein Poli38472_004548 [Pythium oligandrum]